MSYITKSDIEVVEAKLGRPETLQVEIETDQAELDRIRQSQSDGRAHDITVFIRDEDRFLFIAKHFYPNDLFRAPSGAARSGEGLIEGAKREAYEETGVDIELKQYLLRIKSQFLNYNDKLNWTSYVFLADYKSGDIEPQDIREIRSARWVTINEIPRFNKIMRSVNIAGFRYRIFLTNNSLAKLAEAEHIDPELYQKLIPELMV